MQLGDGLKPSYCFRLYKRLCRGRVFRISTSHICSTHTYTSFNIKMEHYLLLLLEWYLAGHIQKAPVHCGNENCGHIMLSIRHNCSQAMRLCSEITFCGRPLTKGNTNQNNKNNKNNNNTSSNNNGEALNVIPASGVPIIKARQCRICMKK